MAKHKSRLYTDEYDDTVAIEVAKASDAGVTALVRFPSEVQRVDLKVNDTLTLYGGVVQRLFEAKYLFEAAVWQITHDTPEEQNIAWWTAWAGEAKEWLNKMENR